MKRFFFANGFEFKLSLLTSVDINTFKITQIFWSEKMSEKNNTYQYILILLMGWSSFSTGLILSSSKKQNAINCEFDVRNIRISWVWKQVNVIQVFFTMYIQQYYTRAYLRTNESWVFYYMYIMVFLTCSFNWLIDWLANLLID